MWLFQLLIIIKTSTFFLALIPFITTYLCPSYFSTVFILGHLQIIKNVNDFLFLFKFLVLLYDLISSRGLASTGCIPNVFLFQFSRSVQCQNSQKIKAMRLLKQASVLTTIPQSAKEKRGINLELSQKPALNGWVLSWLIFWCNSCIRSKGEIVFLPAHIPSSHCGCEGGEAQQSFIFSFKARKRNYSKCKMHTFTCLIICV